MSIGFNPTLNTVQRNIQPKFSGEFTIKGTEANFDQEVLNSDIPVLVDFWAAWCGPCKTIAPFLENLAQEFKGKVKIVKVNVDEERSLLQNKGIPIQSIPTLIMFDQGKPVAAAKGAMPEEKLRQFITANS